MFFCGEAWSAVSAFVDALWLLIVFALLINCEVLSSWLLGNGILCFPVNGHLDSGLNVHNKNIKNRIV